MPRAKPGPKQHRNAADTKKRILDAAEAEFAARGFDGARLGRIAEAASVQQALIHHYFADKAGLYREVIDRALSSITTEGWDILLRTVRSVSSRKDDRARGARMTEAELRPLVLAFVELLQRFFLQHRAVLAIVANESRTDNEDVALELIRVRVRPVADATTVYLEALRKAGEIRGDVDVQKLCTAAISMVAFPLLEQSFLSALWPVDPSSKKYIEATRAEIVEMLVRHILP
jgi:TetR/AcrR family transcriptional regulator